MLRRPFCGMAAGFLLGIWITAYANKIFLLPERFMIPLCIGVLLRGVMPFVRELYRQRQFAFKEGQRVESSETGEKRAGQYQHALCILFGALLFVLGSVRYASEQGFREAYLPYLKDGMQLSVQGELAAKQIKNNQYIYELESCVIGLYQKELLKTVPVRCNRILMYSDSDAYSIGEILILDGKIKLWESAVNEGNFDAKSFYETRRIDFELVDAKVHSVYGRKDALREGLWELRLRLKEVYQHAMEEETCGILTTMVLGDKELLDAETRRLYQIGGLSHILAISGLHISVIGMSLYHFLRKRGLGFLPAGVIAGTVLCAYGTMVGMGTSVCRSIIMFLLLLVGQVIGRSYDTLNSLGIAVVILLWKNPLLLWDAGFLFSFAAIIGVIWVGQCVSFGKSRMERLRGRLFVSAAIQLATLPLAAWYYYEVPAYALILNLLILPMTAPLLGLGVAGGFAGLFSEHLAAVILFPCEKLLIVSNRICGGFAGIPGAMQIIGRPKMWQVCVYYGLLMIFTLQAYRRKREEKAMAAGMMRLLIAGGILLVVLCFPSGHRFELDMLDVGQGDAGFLRTEEGYTVFVDGGSSNVGKVGEYRILPFLKYKGVREIDYWFVSHTDNDHISGLEEILEQGYEVKHLILADGIGEDEAYETLMELAEGAGVEVLLLGAGDILHLGKAKIRILAPVPGAHYADKNEASLVFLYEEGEFSGIFSGDVDAAGERKLLEYLGKRQENGAMPAEIDFYKAAHHGSGYSNSEEFLQLLSPAVSVVSCAAKNRYGHPGAEAVAHMKDAGSEVFYTMNAGQITVTVEEGRLVVNEHLEAEKK